jgi:hypothetical protein
MDSRVMLVEGGMIDGLNGDYRPRGWWEVTIALKYSSAL